MSVTRAQLEALESYFLQARIPDKLRINEAVVQYNVAGFINDKINILRSGTLSETITLVFYDHLLEIKRLLEQQ